MNFQNNRYTLRYADASDNEGIKEIFESGSFQGDFNIHFLRNPFPFESFAEDGDEARILVIIDNDNQRYVAVGGAVVREEYVNGKAEKCAYLTGLKIHPDYQKKIFFLPQAYQLMGDGLKDCAYIYTTILDSNDGVVKMLEKKRKNMPEYRYLGHYTTYCFHGGKKKLKLEIDNTKGFDVLMEKYFSKQSFVPCNSEYKGYGEKTFYSIRKNGEIIACCFVGNQQRSKQYKMCGYGGVYRWLSKIPTQWFGYPKFPKENSVINHGIISYLYVKDNDNKLCKNFLRTVAKISGYDLLLWGGFENNPLTNVLDSMKTIKYGSRLYSVIWEENVMVQGVIGVEVALL